MYVPPSRRCCTVVRREEVESLRRGRADDTRKVPISQTAYRLQSTVCNPRELGRHQSQSIASGYAWLKRECTDNIPTSSPIGTLPYLHVPTGRSQVQPYRYRQVTVPPTSTGTSYLLVVPPVLTREFKAPDVPATPRDRPTFVRKETSHGVGGGGGWAALWLDLT